MQEDNLFKKIFGSLVGGALWDAFGIRVEHFDGLAVHGGQPNRR